MRNILANAAIGVTLLGALLAPLRATPTSSDQNEGLMLTPEASPGVYSLSWWGKLGRSYFVQYSEDLVSPWSYMPIIEAGQDAPLNYGFTNTAQRFFFRLKFSEQATNNPNTADFDGDGISNWEELQQGCDPFAPLGARLAITWPTEGATVNARTVDVLGTWGAIASLRSLTLNGAPVFIAGNTWSANAVPLALGVNTFTLSAIDSKGITTSITRSITATFNAEAAPPVSLHASTVTGPAPLAVTFTPELNAPGTIESVTFYFENRTVGTPGGTSLAPVVHQYTEPGTFYPTVTIKFTDGSSYSSGGQQTPIQDRLTIKAAGSESPLNAWSNLKNAVKGQDIEAIASSFSSAGSANYRELFTLGTFKDQFERWLDIRSSWKH